MKTKLLLLLMLICFVSLSAIPQKPQWEYKFEYKCTEKRLNELASQGWELAQYATSPMSGGSMALDVCIVRKNK